MAVVQDGAVGTTAADAGVGRVTGAAIVVYPVSEHALQLILTHSWPRAPHDLGISVAHRERGRGERAGLTRYRI